MNESDVQKKASQLSKLAQYSDKSEEELRAIAIKALNKKSEYKPKFTGLSKEESKDAKEQFDLFCNTYHVDGLNNLMWLEERCWLVARNNSYKQAILDKNALADKCKEEGLKVLKKLDGFNKDEEKAYNDRLRKIDEIDKKLGLVKEKKNSGLSDWEMILTKAQKDVEEYPAEHEVKCPYCLKIFKLLYRTTNYDAYPDSMFKDTFLYNEGLMEFIDQGKLTVEDVAYILKQPRTDYVKRMYERIYLKEKRLKARDKDARKTDR